MDVLRRVIDTALLGIFLFIFCSLQLDLYLLSQKWKELVEKARSKQLQPHEYNSGTNTSLSVFEFT